MNEEEKMLSGEIYNANYDEELLKKEFWQKSYVKNLITAKLQK